MIIGSPTLGVVTPVLKNSIGVLRTISSVRAQREQLGETLKHVIVVPETDYETLAALKELEFGKITEEILVEEEEVRGIYPAMNLGVEKASLKGAEYIAILGAGDYYPPGALTRVAAEIATNPSVPVFYGDLLIVRPNGQPLRIWHSPEYDPIYIKFGWMAPHPTMFVKSGCYSRHKFLENPLHLPTAADYEHFLRLSLEYEFRYIPGIVTVMEAGGASSQNRRKAYWEDVFALEKNDYSPSAAQRIAYLKRFSKLGQLVFPRLRSGSLTLLNANY